MRIITFFLCAFVIIMPLTASAFYKGTVARDMSALEAVLVDGPGGLTLLDKGYEDGVHKGDLWTVYGPGKKVKGPSGKSLGEIKEPIARARVTKPEKKFSVVNVECIKKKCKLNAGLSAKRFAEVKAFFYDIGGGKKDMYEWLRANIPHLKWQDYREAVDESQVVPTQNDIFFVAKKGSLTVWSGGEIKGAYNRMGSAPMASYRQPIGRTAYPSSLPPGLAGARTSLQPTLPGLASYGGLATKINITSYRPVGSLDQLVHSLEINDLDASGPPYFVYLLGPNLYAQKIGARERITYSYKGFGNVLYASVGENGLIALNIYIKGEGLRSKVLKFKGNSFHEISTDREYVFCFFDLDGDGKKETLLGQNYNELELFGPAIYRFEIGKSGVKRKGRFSVPSGFTLNGAMIADLTGNRTKEMGFYNLGRRFVVYERDSEIWSSPEALGGSIKSVQVPNLEPDDPTPQNVIIWCQPAIISFGVRKVAAIPANESSLWNVVGASPKKGGLGILFSTGGGIRFSELATDFAGPVQDIFVYKDELYIVVVEGNFFTGRGRTHVLAISLKDIANALM